MKRLLGILGILLLAIFPMACQKTYSLGPQTSSSNNVADITTVAGNGVTNYSGDNGPATSAELNLPAAVAVDSSGNLYIADTYNNCIRKVNTSGTITTVAGNGTEGYSGDNGPATSAELNWPMGVAVDSSGNIYIGDTNNNRVRVVNSGGTITTFAGNGTPAYSGDNGPATLAELYMPYGVAVDTSGNLFIGEMVSDRVRKINSSGTITTVAGDGTSTYNGDNGPATLAQFGAPEGVAISSSGNLYITDPMNLRVRMVNTSQIIVTVAGDGTQGSTGDGGPATSAELIWPAGVALDFHNNLYIADPPTNRVRVVNTGETISTVAGTGTAGFSGDGGPAASAELNSPNGVAVDSSGNLYIADSGNCRIRKVTF